MNYIGIILLAWMSITNRAGQDLYVCKTAKVTFYSNAPIEDIRASTFSGASVFNAATGELDFSVPIRSFEFEKSLMQEHFNSDYMESDKYPRATFKSKLNERVDVTKDGSYTVTATGDFTVHGVTKIRTITGNISIKNAIVTITSEFMVKCADHHIDIPKIVFHNIAESIKMTVSANYVLNK